MAGPQIRKGHIIGAIVVAVAFLAIAIFLLGILASWLLILLSLGGFTSWPKIQNPKNVIIYFGISLAFVCAALSLGSKLELIHLSKEADKAIWRALIVSILTAVAAAFAKAI